jgi:hypothetical protein
VRGVPLAIYGQSVIATNDMISPLKAKGEGCTSVRAEIL